MTKTVFKFSDDRENFLKVGVLTDDNEVVFYEPQHLNNTRVTQYSPSFYTLEDDGEYNVFYPKKVKEITTQVEGLSCAIGYIDQNDSIVFYDQYLES